jgi:formylglycine-generating enzyme required for sulfatase activity
MALIPAGSFLMGSATGQANEAPEHEVTLDAFYLDIFEVSNAQYRACVEDGGCTPSIKADSYTYTGYRDDPKYNDYPVVGVTWDQTAAYCSWAGKRLPTEAEWEYAASGPENLTWPWGNTFEANLSAASAPDTQPVDSYPGGVSPFGVYNMAGNVAEWVADVYDETFYANSPARNPLSSGDGAGRIFRGGSFANLDGAFFTTSRRYGNARTFFDVDLGFRCARDG